MKIRATSAICVLVLGVAAGGVQAQKVNKWVDEDGVTHFSDQKPVGDDADVNEIEIPKGAVSEYESEKVNERVNSVLQQMEQDRKAREAEAAAQKKAKEAREALKREPIVVEEKKQKNNGKRHYYGPYPKPLPGPFPEQYPRPAGPAKPGNSGGPTPSIQ